MRHEVLDHWWEYFPVLWWSLFPPTDLQLLPGIEAPTKDSVEQQYKQKVADLLSENDKGRIEALKDFLKSSDEREEDRKKTIEGKAHSLLGQTGISASLLAGGMSLVSSQILQQNGILSTMIALLTFVIVLHFIAAGLHARHALTLIHRYQEQDMDDYLGKPDQIDFITTAAFHNEHNSYLNDLKATHLKLAHWLLKCAFVLLLMSAATIPPAIILSRTANPKHESHRPVTGCSPGQDSCRSRHGGTRLINLGEPTCDGLNMKSDSLAHAIRKSKIACPPYP